VDSSDEHPIGINAEEDDAIERETSEYASSIPRDRIDAKIEDIRARRTKSEATRFPRTFEDLLLIIGFAYGILYAILLIIVPLMPAAMSESVWIDRSFSQTMLDTGDPCEDRESSPWINAYPNNDAHVIVMTTQNVNIQNTNTSIILDANAESATYVENTSRFQTPFSGWDEGEHTIRISVGKLNQTSNQTEEVVFAELKVTISKEEKGFFAFLPGVSSKISEHASIEREGARGCWSTKSLAGWGWGLMAAELGGGRETAMLTGGAAGVPAWWMAFISFSLSLVSLFILYPLLYKVYHQSIDDQLTDEETERLALRCIEEAAEKYALKVDWASFDVNIREVSIDIFVAYQVTSRTALPPDRVKQGILKVILKEFSTFRIFKPMRLKAEGSEGEGPDFLAVGFDHDTDDTEDEGDDTIEIEDYSTFFAAVSDHSSARTLVNDAVKNFFHKAKPGLKLVKALMITDPDLDEIYVRVSFVREKKSDLSRKAARGIDITDELHQYILKQLGDSIGSRKLRVAATNPHARDSSYIEHVGKKEKHGATDDEALIARQAGISGQILQSSIVSGILSTVEFTASENRRLIDRWGFFGLIIFVWIPFLASGVIVGAVLGLVARMRSQIVIAATLVGGVAASITWAYSAQWIIELMHKWKLEALIPFVIATFVFIAFLHMRSTKKRREAELFEVMQKEALVATIESDVQVN